MAIAHIILMKVKPSVTEDQAQDILRAVVSLYEQLPGVIESVHLGANTSARSKGFTHGFTMIFKDRAALETYEKSPQHVKTVQEIIRPKIDDILCVDYDVADYSVPRL